jgi:hypothetical protein
VDVDGVSETVGNRWEDGAGVGWGFVGVGVRSAGVGGVGVAVVGGFVGVAIVGGLVEARLLNDAEKALRRLGGEGSDVAVAAGDCEACPGDVTCALASPDCISSCRCSSWSAFTSSIGL